jgi:hypothetical protein
LDRRKQQWNSRDPSETKRSFGANGSVTSDQLSFTGDEMTEHIDNQHYDDVSEDEGGDRVVLERRPLNAAENLTNEVEDELDRRLALGFSSIPRQEQAAQFSAKDSSQTFSLQQDHGEGYETKRPQQPKAEPSSSTERGVGVSSHRRYIVAQEPVRLAPITSLPQ